MTCVQRGIIKEVQGMVHVQRRARDTLHVEVEEAVKERRVRRRV